MNKALVFLAFFTATGAFAEERNQHIETAARMNVAENLCDINFGQTRGVVHHVLLGAAQLNISLEYAAILADKRHAEIVRYLNRVNKLDEFCRNARAGKL